MRKIKTLLIAAVLVVLGANVFAADATVTFVSGKVEVQRNGKWIALQKGDSVAKSETISTGFQSEAKIKLMDSVMYLGPVTRITVEELSTVDQTDNVNVYLKTGTARSQVKHVDNKRVNYQVHTAVAVASCRGTDWILDDSNTVSGLDGIIEVTSTDDESSGGTLVKANQTVVVSDNKTVSDPVVTVIKTASDVTGTVTTAGAKEGEGGAGVDTTTTTLNIAEDTAAAAGNGNVNLKGTVVVTVEIPEEYLQ